jgi:hypothetical protein
MIGKRMSETNNLFTRTFDTREKYTLMNGKTFYTWQKTIPRNPYRRDKKQIVNNDKLKYMLESEENYKEIFLQTYKKLTGKQYKHCSSLCYTFLQFNKECPTQFIMSYNG